MSLTERKSEIAQLSGAELEALRSTIEAELLKKAQKELPLCHAQRRKSA